MKSNLIYLVMALITGALIPIQAATNAAFSKSIGNPYITGIMVFIVGLAGMIVFAFISRVSIPTAKQLVAAPSLRISWWNHCGHLCTHDHYFGSAHWRWNSDRFYCNRTNTICRNYRSLWPF